MRPTGQRDLRRHNTTVVLDAVAAGGGSRAGVAAATGLAKATVSSLVDRLVAAGLVTETGPESRPGRGRRGTGLALAPTGPHGVGLEIGVDYLATCLTDPTGREHAFRLSPGDNRDQPPSRVLTKAKRAVRRAVADAGAMGVPVGGLGIAVPGLVERETGVLLAAPNLGWSRVDLRAAFPGAAVDNEANHAALAELWHGAGGRDFVLVSGEIGIGAGIVSGGAVFGGVRGFSGEIGHLCVDPTGPPCPCGARGCLERVAGLETLTGGEPVVALDGLIRKLSEKDGQALSAVNAAGTVLGVALAGVVNVLDIPTIVLGGGYARLHQWLAPPLRAELELRVVGAPWSAIEVRASELGSRAAVRGAATAVTRAILADPDPYIDRVLDTAAR
ncbi:ROK family transcriptional regulator [Actinokineospora sp. NBRC 105648]|uniref:ROK family transcriptional regulator n=1 Tax=Actinokineospora sp. NBRC 105648 TaxID=3032206 RepID=UPI0024A55517|nr:ROK family transcriptional regulator [Actinokineospora sp. NBRC 105648]GLZ43731.1 xylose repressor [Actinokineospora sp. NBRC 105648]